MKRTWLESKNLELVMLSESKWVFENIKKNKIVLEKHIFSSLFCTDLLHTSYLQVTIKQRDSHNQYTIQTHTLDYYDIIVW